MNFLLPEIAVDDVQSLLWQLCKNFSAKVIWMTMQLTQMFTTTEILPYKFAQHSKNIYNLHLQYAASVNQSTAKRCLFLSYYMY